MMPKAEKEAFTNTLMGLCFFRKFKPGFKGDYLFGANFSKNQKAELNQG